MSKGIYVLWIFCFVLGWFSMDIIRYVNRNNQVQNTQARDFDAELKAIHQKKIQQLQEMSQITKDTSKAFKEYTERVIEGLEQRDAEIRALKEENARLKANQNVEF